MATHSSILAWKNPMDRGARQATVHGVAWVRYNLGIRPPPYRKDHDTGVIGSFYMTKCTHLFGIHISNEINLWNLSKMNTIHHSIHTFSKYSITGLPSQLSWWRIHLQCSRLQLDSWVRKIFWRRDRLPTPAFLGFPCGSAGKETACNVGDLGSIPGLGRSPGEGKGYPLQYSSLENSMDCNSPWGHKQSDTTERLSLSLSITSRRGKKSHR